MGMTVGVFVVASEDEFGVEEEVVEGGVKGGVVEGGVVEEEEGGMEEGDVGEAMDVGATMERGENTVKSQPYCCHTCHAADCDLSWLLSHYVVVNIVESLYSRRVV